MTGTTESRMAGGHPKRMTAKHALAREVLEGSFVRGDAESGEASFVESGGERFSRVVLAGTVVEKNEGENALEVKLLDASGAVSCRAFDERGRKALQGINKGEDAVIIGKLRETQERFLAVESAWRLDDLNWESVHLLRAAIRKRS